MSDAFPNPLNPGRVMPKKQANVESEREEFTVTVSGDSVIVKGTLELRDPVYVKAFQQEKVKGTEPKKFFLDALRLGVYGKMEARISAFLKTAENDLQTGLEHLKYIFTAQEFIEKSAAKGQIAEGEIENALKELIKRKNWGDTTTNTGGNVGEIPECKIGDIVCDVGESSRRVVIEAKMNQSMTLGDAKDMNEKKGKNWVKNATDTAYGQLALSRANRNANFAIIVFDRDSCSPPIKNLEPITILSEIPGMVVKIGRETGDFTALELAYGIARDLAKAYEKGIDELGLGMVVKRLIRDANKLNKFSVQLDKVVKGANDTIDAVTAIRDIVDDTQKSLSMTQSHLTQMLNGSPPNAKELADYYVEANFDKTDPIGAT